MENISNLFYPDMRKYFQEEQLLFEIYFLTIDHYDLQCYHIADGLADSILISELQTPFFLFKVKASYYIIFRLVP